MTEETLNKANDLDNRIRMLTSQLDSLKREKCYILDKLSITCDRSMPEEYQAIEDKVKKCTIEIVTKELSMYKREFAKL